jgi:hypothetical protein
MFRKRLENELEFPKELNKIIIEYTLVNPTKFFRDYYQPLPKKSRFFCKACKHTELIDIERNIACSTRCHKCKYDYAYIRPANFFKLSKCENCERNTYIEKRYDDIALYGCLRCTEFDYCVNAESDNDVCQYSLECFICNERTCIHGVALERNSELNSVLCIDCKNTFLIGKKIIKMMSSNKIKTFDSLLKELL